MIFRCVSNHSIILRIIAASLLFGMLVTLCATYYLRHSAQNDLAIDDADKRGALVFELIKNVLNENDTHDHAFELIEHLNRQENGIQINIYSARSALLGIPSGYNEQIEHDPLMQSVLKNRTMAIVNNRDTLRRLYPLVFENSCVKCHHNAVAAETAALVDIRFSSSIIRLHLDALSNKLFIFQSLFLALFLGLLYILIRRYILTPVCQASSTLETLTHSIDPNNRMHSGSKITEIQSLENSFNAIMEKFSSNYDEMLKKYYLDPLTDLPNLIRLQHDIHECEDENPSLLIINIDGFKSINSFYGYQTGNDLLINLKEKVEPLLDDTQQLYRVSGSEFAVFQPFQLEFASALDILEKLNSAPYRLKEVELLISITAGFACEKERLFEKASAALNEAKKKRQPIEYYYKDISKAKEFELNAEWTNILKDAIDHNRIVTYYQPIYCVKTQEIKKYETLVRLLNQNNEVFTPYYFLGIAKQSRYYSRITQIVVKSALEYFKDKTVEFSINLSIDDILDTSTKNYILILLKNFPQPQRVIFELLESEEVEEFDHLKQFIKEVKTIGAKIAIDDFGSGYSNFAYLAEIEADYIKIDSSLIRKIVFDPNSYLIVKTIVTFAKQLGTQTIAEYVSSEEIYEKAKELDIDYMQGYYFGEPGSSIL